MYKLSAIQLRDLFLEGSISSSEITNYFLKRVSYFDPKINSFLKVLNERAEKKAKILDQKRASNKPLGKLAGIPVVIKDIINIDGEITTCGSKFLENYKAVFDATVIKLLEEEDAIIIGKTNLDEFAMGSSTEHSAFFPTKNPWDLKCSPGGSSGGSAAAVAARFAPIGFGSDTAGSVRHPSAFCGIVGFKPTYGRISRYGLVAFASSLDHVSPMAANVSDIGLVMEVVGRHCRHDATSLNLPMEKYLDQFSNSLDGIKIGVPWKFLENLKKDMHKSFLSSLDVAKQLGASIVDINLDILKYAIPIYYILAPAEASTNLARFDGIRYGKRSQNAKTLDEIYDLSRQEGFGTEVKRRIMLGTYVLSAGYKDAYYKKAQKIRTVLIRSFKEAFKKCDLIAIPTTPSTAFEIGAIKDPIEEYLEDLFTVGSNLAGLPSISIPSGFCEKQRPVGFQLVGPLTEDVKVVKYAYAFEQAFKTCQKIPLLFNQEAFNQQQ